MVATWIIDEQPFLYFDRSTENLAHSSEAMVGRNHCMQELRQAGSQEDQMESEPRKRRHAAGHLGPARARSEVFAQRVKSSPGGFFSWATGKVAPSSLSKSHSIDSLRQFFLCFFALARPRTTVHKLVRKSRRGLEFQWQRICERVHECSALCPLQCHFESLVQNFNFCR